MNVFPKQSYLLITIIMYILISITNNKSLMDPKSPKKKIFINKDIENIESADSYEFGKENKSNENTESSTPFNKSLIITNDKNYEKSNCNFITTYGLNNIITQLRQNSYFLLDNLIINLASFQNKANFYSFCRCIEKSNKKKDYCQKLKRMLVEKLKVLYAYVIKLVNKCKTNKNLQEKKKNEIWCNFQKNSTQLNISYLALDKKS